MNKMTLINSAAGSGKTERIADSLLELLKEEEPRSILALTFTEKAAAEMQHRVLSKLRRALEDPALNHRQQNKWLDLWFRLIERPGLLRISTIHSYGLDLLRRFPLEAGVDPAFGILDEQERMRQEQLAWEAAYRAWQDPGNPGYGLRNSLEAQTGRYTFTALMKALLKERKILVPSLSKAEFDNPEFQQRLTETVNTTLDTVWESFISQFETAGLRHNLGELASKAENLPIEADLSIWYELAANKGQWSAAEVCRLAQSRLSGQSGFLTTENLPRSNPFPKKTAGEKSSALKELYMSIADIVSQLYPVAESCRFGEEEASRLSLWITAYRLFLDLETYYQNIKESKRCLDFDDLEIFSYTLISENPQVLYRLDHTLSHMLLDEFQDTSDLQWQIFEPLVEEWLSGEGSKAGPTSLLAVGDPRQSVYLFRGADVRLFHQLEKRILELPEENGRIERMSSSWRSAKNIVDSVNKLFSGLGPEFMPIDTRRDFAGSVSLKLLLSDSIEEEADYVAKHLKKIIESLPIQPKNGEERPMTWADIAILFQNLRSGNQLKAWERVLRLHDIPFRVHQGFGFMDRPEIQDLMALIKTAINPYDDFALSHWLLSPAAGISDSQMWTLSTTSNQPLWVSFSESEHTEAYQALAELVSLEKPFHLALETFLDQTGFLDTYETLEGTQAVANIRKFLLLAKEHFNKFGNNIWDFYRKLYAMQTAAAIEPEAQDEIKRNEILISTVHQAKGLEYGYVVIPAVEKLYNLATPKVIQDKDLAVISIGGSDRDPKCFYEDLYKRMLKEEKRRLLYVAMTRACDHLLLTGKLLNSRGNTSLPAQEKNWLYLLNQGWELGLGEHIEVRSLDLPCGVAVEILERPSEPSIQPTIHQTDQLNPTSVIARSGMTKQSQSQASGQKIATGSQSPHNDEKYQLATDSCVMPGSIGHLSYRFRGNHGQSSQNDNESGVPPIIPQSAIRNPQSKNFSLLTSNGISNKTRGTLIHKALELLSKGTEPDHRLWAGDIIKSNPLLTLEKALLLAQEIYDQALAVFNNPEFSWIFDDQYESWSELEFIANKEGETSRGIIDRIVIKDSVAHIIDFKTSATAANQQANRQANQPTNIDQLIDRYRPQVELYCSAATVITGLPAKGYILLDNNLAQLI